ncbi:tetratricopeptide repeat protein [Paenibacillus sp. MBLB4367]|uniref:tetratricopeptide repeat protein n=1 Tax=Paenibacillus sp. MBLB4367 TaxID=3384767 RepID=UPI0039080D06
MGKIIGFVLLWRLLGNPILALLVLLAILYLLDRRFIGLMPSFVKPFKRSRKLARLRQELAASPHHTSGKLEAARLLIEKKKYKEALDYLEQVRPIMDDSAEVIYETGFCRLKLGDIAEGERLVLQSLQMNPRLKYGEPYLKLGEAFAESDPGKAISYLMQFRTEHSSSCEAYYRLGKLYAQLGRAAEAKDAFRETVQIYRSLPKYKRRSERKWALLARLQRG